MVNSLGERQATDAGTTPFTLKILPKRRGVKKRESSVRLSLGDTNETEVM